MRYLTLRKIHLRLIIHLINIVFIAFNELQYLAKVQFLSNRNIPTDSISNIHQMISDGIWEDMKEMRMHFNFGNDVEVSCLKGNDSS